MVQINNAALRRVIQNDPKVVTLHTRDDAYEHLEKLMDQFVGASSANDQVTTLALIRRIQAMTNMIYLDVRQCAKKNPIKIFGYEGVIDVSRRKH